MHVLVPSGNWMIPEFVGDHEWEDGTPGPFYFALWRDGGYLDVDMPTFWRATEGREYNDVSHGKPVGYAKDEFVPFFDGGKFIPGVGVGMNGKYPELVYYPSRNNHITGRITTLSYGKTYYTVEFTFYCVYFKPKPDDPDIKYYIWDKYEQSCKIRFRWEKGKYWKVYSSSGSALMLGVVTQPMYMAVASITPEYGKDYHRVWVRALQKATPLLRGFVTDQAFLFNFSGMRKKNPVSKLKSDGHSVVPPTLPIANEADQLFAEAQTQIDGVDPVVALGKSGLHYWRSYLISEAYYDACRNVPRLNDNSVSNVLEIASFIKGLVIDHRVEIPHSLSDAWLSYRYQYGTGKMDIEEAIQFVHRHMDLQGVDEITSYGECRHDVDGTDVVCRCCFHIAPKDVGNLQKLWRGLYTYGLTPSFYVIWDMIPYSFIVDWLIPIGEIAGRLDATAQYSGTNYQISDIQFSLTYERKGADGKLYHWYTRWVQGTPPEMLGVYAFEKTSSMKTWGYRALDTLSLLVK